MILAIDCHAANRSNRPRLRQRLWERRVVLENRHLNRLCLTDTSLVRADGNGDTKCARKNRSPQTHDGIIG